MQARLYWGLLVLIVLAAAALRFDGLRWDDGSHPHPDERFLTIVASAVHSGTLTPTDRDESARQAHLAACVTQFPDTRGVGGWFASQCSDFNPSNVGYAGYAYGQFPLALVRVAAEATAHLSGRSEYTQYGGIHVVGRAVSAVADLLTLLTVFLLGRLLWCRAVGVLAASFYAVAVLPIQSAHFWTVDSLATLFASLSVLYAVRLVRFGDRGDALALGAACALAAASKISLAPLAVLLPLAAYLAPSRVVFSVRPDWLTRASIRLPAVLLGCAGAAITFRIASPYAFSGPSWYDLGLAQPFFDQIQESRRLASGIVDIPPNWQWLGRPPWLWAGQNLLVWGLGLALGLTAVMGVGRRGWRLLRATPIEKARAIPWLWLVGYFFWMGQQWVASMRYFLPVYPLLCLFAAAWLLPWWRAWRIANKGRGSFARRAWWPAAISVVVLASTGVWALAVHTVHTTLHPYVAATNWIVRNVPGPVSAPISTMQHTSVLLNWPAAGVYGDGSVPRVAPTTIAPANGTIDHLQLHDVEVIRSGPAARIVARVLDANGRPIAETTPLPLPSTTTSPGARHGNLDLPLLAPLDLTGGLAYRLQVEVKQGAVTLAGSRIAYEGAWNDVVPARVPRLAPADVLDLRGASGTVIPGGATVDPFAEGYYVPLDLAMTTEDDEAKRGRLIERIDEAEWLIVPNNRFYDSMPRNALRFPLSTRFYDALFSGELGYERFLVVDSLPRFAGVTVDDQSLPSPGQGVTSGRSGLAWAAEEAFSVYDHPTVFVFHKTSGYSRATVERIFRPLNLTTIDAALAAEKPAGAGRLAWSTHEAGSAPDGLLRKTDGDAAVVTGQEPAAANPWVTAGAVIGWYGISLLLGGLAWPWLASLWPGLPDRGYGVARIAGLAAVATAAWWLTWLGLPAWSAGGLTTIIAVVAVVTFPIVRRCLRRERDWLKSNARTLLVMEAAFLALFALGLLLRGLDPDLWAPAFGGEKPMDFALLNSVLASTDFPPADPWFSGGRLNYYYFGWVLVGVATKLTGVAPAIAYNLALPTWWAMTGSGAFSLAWNAYGKASGGRVRRRWLAGAVALVAVALLGNLDLPRAVVPNLKATQALVTSAQPADGAAWKDALTRNSERWLWAPSRTVGEREHSSHEINEFPAFTFLYGDLHPHLMAWPLQLFVLTGLLALVLPVTSAGTETKQGARALLSQIAVVALGVGLLRATNFWDWPFYLVLAGLGSVFAAWRSSQGLLVQTPARMQSNDRLVFVALAVIAIVVAQAVVALPFSSSLVTGELSVRWFDGARTPLLAWLAMQGWFLLVIGGWAWQLACEPWVRPAPAAAASLVLRVLRVARWSGIGYAVLSAAVVAVTGAGEIVAVGVQVALLAWLIELLWRNLAYRTRTIGLLAAVLAFALDLLVEFVVLGQDIGRMNTYFKVHLQIWILLSVAAGIAIAELAGQGALRRGARLYAGLIGIASLLALAYMPLATYGRSQTRFDSAAPFTLNGEAFMANAIYDYQGRSLKLADDLRLITWLRNHTGIDDVVLEAQLPEYRWGSRMSVFTGRQTVLGYRHHESQQRPVAEIGKAIELRRQNVEAMYKSTDTEAVLQVLRHYRVRYVVVGGLERAAYPPAGIEKFNHMVANGELETAFKSGDDVIYRVVAATVEQPTGGAHW